MTQPQTEAETGAESFERFERENAASLPYLSLREVFILGFNRGFTEGNYYGKAQQPFIPPIPPQFAHEDAQTFREVPEDFALEPALDQADGIYS